MKVSILGAGCGDEGTWTHSGLQALENAQVVIGAKRLLEGLSKHVSGTRVPAVSARDILETICGCHQDQIAVVYSGDIGFYSGARQLIPLLEQEGIAYTAIPGVSSLSAFAARLARPWQDWRLVSAHGVPCDAVHEVMQGAPAFFLTGGRCTPAQLCGQLAAAGLGTLGVTVGENLFSPEERILSGTAEDMQNAAFAPLSVLLAEAAPVYPRRVPGIPDEEFIRGNVPMTKREIRCAALSGLQVGPEDVCWDIGAGTGSVSVELALQSRQVWAVERNPDALALIDQNREKFSAWNLRVQAGSAPEVLTELPMPDKVFLGGSGGNLKPILREVFRRNPQVRVCVSAIALETLSGAMETLTALGCDPEITQISVCRGKRAGALHLMQAGNPIYLLTGARK